MTKTVEFKYYLGDKFYLVHVDTGVINEIYVQQMSLIDNGVICLDFASESYPRGSCDCLTNVATDDICGDLDTYALINSNHSMAVNECLLKYRNHEEDDSYSDHYIFDCIELAQKKSKEIKNENV